jgi:O-antigen/teichoic acid export membrane protein
MKAYSRGHARRSVIHTAIFRVITQLTTLAGYIVLVRGMTEQAFGVLSLLYATLMVISTVASLGIEQTLRRYQPEYLQQGKPEAAHWLLRRASLARFVTNLVVLGLILLSWRWLAPVFQLGPYRAEFLLFCIPMLLHFQVSILTVSLSSHMQQAYSVGSVLLLSLTKLIAYTVLTLEGNLTLTNAIITEAVGYALYYVGLKIAHNRFCRPPADAPAFHADPTERKRLLRYSLYNNFNDTGSLLLTSKTDNFFIAAFMTPIAVGAYSFYTRLNEMVSQVIPTRQFSNVIQPLFFSVPRAEAAERLPKYFTLLVNLTMILQWPMAAFATTYHREIVAVLFGGKFIESSWLLPMVVWFSTVNRISDPVTLVAQYEEKPWILLLSKFSALYNVIMMLALVPVAGLLGAAIATGTAQVLKNYFVWWHVRGNARWLNVRPALAASVLIWGAVIAIGYALKASLAVHDVVHLAIGAVVCGLAVLVHVRSAALAPSDRSILESVFGGRERRVLSLLGLLPQGKVTP